MNKKLTNLENILTSRVAQLKQWLDEYGGGCREQQAQLEEGSEARAYWHYGYWVALSDVLTMLAAAADE